MNKEIILKAIKENKCKIILDMKDESVNFIYQDKDCTDYIKKYNIIFPNIETVNQAIQYAVNYCIENNKVNHYLKELGVLKGIIRYYTDIPNDYFSDDELDIIINKGIVSYANSNTDSNENSALRRYYEAVVNEIDNIVIKFNNSSFRDFTFDNEETKKLLFNVFENFLGNDLDNSLNDLT